MTQGRSSSPDQTADSMHLPRDQHPVLAFTCFASNSAAALHSQVGALDLNPQRLCRTRTLDILRCRLHPAVHSWTLKVGGYAVQPLSQPHTQAQNEQTILDQHITGKASQQSARPGDALCANSLDSTPGSATRSWKASSCSETSTCTRCGRSLQTVVQHHEQPLSLQAYSCSDAAPWRLWQ